MKLVFQIILVLIFGSMAIFSWIFWVVPELKNDISNFETFYERMGSDRIVSEIGEPLPEPIKTQDLIRQKVTKINGDELEISSVLTTYDLFTQEIIFKSDSVFQVNKNTRMHINTDENFMFPNYVEKRDYEFTHPLIYFPTTFVFEGEEQVDGINTYVFSCNSVLDDISDSYPQFNKVILSNSTCKTMVDPITGTEIWFTKIWHDYHISNGQIFSVDKGSSATSEFAKILIIDSLKDKHQIYAIYDSVIPLIIVILVVLTLIITIGYNLSQQRTTYLKKGLKTRTEELKDAKMKKTAEVLYETIPNPVVTFDQNEKLVNCNQSFLDILGFSKDEIIGRYAPDLLIDEDKHLVPDIIQYSLKEKKSMIDVDLHVKKKDSGIFHSLWSHIPMWDDDNEYMGFTAIGLDLTETDKLKDELIKKEKFSTLGQLSANLAHDIRNPLAIIQMCLENMRLLYNPNEQKELQMTKIEHAITRIAHQIDSVLDFVQENPLILSKSKMSKIIDVSLGSIIIPTRIKLILPKNDIDLVCDWEKLSISLYNIILNSIQSIVDSGTIEISVEENKDEIVIQVKDSGKGIPKEEFDTIFEPLFTTKQQGTGLGLVSVKSIIEAHGGTISVTSPPTIFTITLPKIPN